MYTQKEILRREFITKCEKVTKDDRLEYAKTSLTHIMPLLDSVNKIVVYHAYGWEMSLSHIVGYCLDKHKNLYQPVTYRNKRKMRLMPYDPKVQNIFVEPDYIPPDSIEWYNVDLIILPLVAIDLRGYRLGKGGGYYDATLIDVKNWNGMRSKLCGIGYSCQMYSGDLPNEDFDVPLDYFVSEDGLISFK